MPKQIVNPLRAGLPSKIYFLAYSGPKSGYEIASKIYGVEKYPPTSKIYSWIKKMEGKELTKTERGYISEVHPLLNEIEVTLKKDHGIELSDLEKRILYRVLDSSEFRSFVENANCNVRLDQDIDSAWLIMSTLGLLATAHLQMIALTRYFGKKMEFKSEPRTEKEFNDVVEKIKTQFEKIGELPPEKKKEMAKILDSFREIMPEEAKSIEARMKDWNPKRFAYFFAMPENLLLKLQRLYPISELTHSLTALVLGFKNLRNGSKRGNRHADSP